MLYKKPTRTLFVAQNYVRVKDANAVMVYDLLAVFDCPTDNISHPVAVAVHVQTIGDNANEYLAVFTKYGFWTVSHGSSLTVEEAITEVCTKLSREIDLVYDDELDENEVYQSLMTYYGNSREIDSNNIFGSGGKYSTLLFKGAAHTIKNYLSKLSDKTGIAEIIDWSITPTVKKELDKAWERYYNEWANTEIA